MNVTTPCQMAVIALVIVIDSPGTPVKERQTVYNFKIPDSEVQRRE